MFFFHGTASPTPFCFHFWYYLFFFFHFFFFSSQPNRFFERLKFSPLGQLHRFVCPGNRGLFRSDLFSSFFPTSRIGGIFFSPNLSGLFKLLFFYLLVFLLVYGESFPLLSPPPFFFIPGCFAEFVFFSPPKSSPQSDPTLSYIQPLAT